MNVKQWVSGLSRRCRAWAAGQSSSLLATGAGVFVLAATLVRAVSGSPYRHGVLLQYGEVIPPVWLMSLLWVVWYALLGAALVYLLCGKRLPPSAQAARYRAGMLYLCMIFLGLFWYPLFFVGGHTFFAALLVILVLALCVTCALWCRCASRLVSMILFAHAGFLLWMVVLSVRVMFL